jgi:DnaJ family protein C protein 7
VEQDPDHRRARELRKLYKAMEKSKNDGNDFFKVGKCNDAIEAYTQALGMDALNVTFNSTVYCNRAAAKMRKKVCVCVCVRVRVCVCVCVRECV